MEILKKDVPCTFKQTSIADFSESRVLDKYHHGCQIIGKQGKISGMAENMCHSNLIIIMATKHTFWPEWQL